MKVVGKTTIRNFATAKDHNNQIIILWISYKRIKYIQNKKAKNQ